MKKQRKPRQLQTEEAIYITNQPSLVGKETKP